MLDTAHGDLFVNQPLYNASLARDTVARLGASEGAALLGETSLLEATDVGRDRSFGSGGLPGRLVEAFVVAWVWPWLLSAVISVPESSSET